MSNEKLVYVPRNWKVSYVDATGNEHKDVELRANAEYRIVASGESFNVSVAGIRTEEDKTYIIAKVVMTPGKMNVMEKVEDLRFDVDTVTEITTIISKYVKAPRGRHEKPEGNVFTFAFDSEKYSSKYRITVGAGEFVSLAVKDINDPNKKSRSFYGHIIDVDSENDIIKFSRYVSNRGVRDIYTHKVPLSALLGVYRYELEFSDAVMVTEPEPFEGNPEPVVENTVESAEGHCIAEEGHCIAED